MEIRMTQGADAEKPLISIIIPAYNAEPYLPGCIDSILKQSYQAYEILLLNDGSTDGTAQLGQQLMAEHTCIRFLSMENQGVSAARNRGIALARGQWLTFVDADDRIHPEMLSHLLQLAAETGSDIVGCDFVTWKTEAKLETAWYRYQQDRNEMDEQRQDETGYRVFTAEEFVAEGILGQNTRCWSKLYRTETARKTEFPAGLTIGEDMLYLLKLMPHITGVTISKKKEYGYYQNPRGAMQGTFQNSYLDQITCWEQATRIIQENYPACVTPVTTITMMAIMLTVGKIACLPAKERKTAQLQKIIKACKEKLKQLQEIPEAYLRLSGGYRIKTQLFLRCTEGYMTAYYMRTGGMFRNARKSER